jgi:hypothetical protein
MDTCFLNFFYYITELLYYKTFKWNKGEFKYDLEVLDYQQIASVYGIEGNIEYLCSVLNYISNIENSDEFFNSLFVSSHYEENKVVLFEKDVNLLDSVILGHKLSIRNKQILYSILFMGANCNLEPYSMLPYLRHVRNMLDRIRQRNKLEIISNLRNQDIFNCISDIEKIIGCKDPYGNEFLVLKDLDIFKVELIEEQEKVKLIVANPEIKDIIYKLEDHNCFRGTLRNLPIENAITKLGQYADLIYEIWDGEIGVW